METNTTHPAAPKMTARLVARLVHVVRGRNRAPMYVVDGPDGHGALLMRTTEDAALGDGLAYFLATRTLGVDGRWTIC